MNKRFLNLFPNLLGALFLETSAAFTYLAWRCVDTGQFGSAVVFANVAFFAGYACVIALTLDKV